MKKILSIDGGGIRGVIPSTILAEIEKRTGRSIYESFDLVTGVSTGGIIALGVSIGMPCNNIIQIYEVEGGKIFSMSKFNALRLLRPVLKPKYSSKNVEDVLQKYFDGKNLSDALTNVMVTSYDIERRKPFFFKSTKAKLSEQDDFDMKNVAKCTSAAPTYFAPSAIKSFGNIISYCIDGAVISNNPAMFGYIESLKLWPTDNDIFVLSLGTGEATKPIKYSSAKNYGLAQWGTKILDVLMQGSSCVVDHELSYALPTDKYIRLQPSLSSGMEALDNASPTNIKKLKDLAIKTINDNDNLINNICDTLKK